MLPAFVLDASVTIAWAVTDEDDPYSNLVLEAMVQHRVLAPALWLWEVGNSLVTAERRGRLTKEETAKFLATLRDLSIKVEPEPAAYLLEELVALARMYQLSVYDAAYLHLAMYQGCPLATIDEALRQAAGQAGVPLFGK
ncbi:MAG: type II toxin-antitoxin system VapC family toxin [Thermodesulfobacteriota bacterium]